MNLETKIILTKAACYVTIGGLGPLVSGLGQWIDTGAWPPGVNWVVIIAGCFIGAATQLLSFFSQSYGNYKTEMKTNGNGNSSAPVTKTA